MHWIQRHILGKLSVSDCCRYTELKPESVDGNLFMYHLNQLTKNGYIKKEDKTYTLTKEGKQFVGSLSLSTGKITRLPRVITTVFCKNNKDEILLYRWSKQPYLGHISLPFNRVRFGQSVYASAKETLKHKTNLSGKLCRAGEASVIVVNNEAITAHYLAHIFVTQSCSGEIFADGLTGEPFWGRIDDYQGSDFVYGTKEIVDLIKAKKSPFFEEILVQK